MSSKAEQPEKTKARVKKERDATLLAKEKPQKRAKGKEQSTKGMAKTAEGGDVTLEMMEAQVKKSRRKEELARNRAIEAQQDATKLAECTLRVTEKWRLDATKMMKLVNEMEGVATQCQGELSKIGDAAAVAKLCGNSTSNALNPVKEEEDEDEGYEDKEDEQVEDDEEGDEQVKGDEEEDIEEKDELASNHFTQSNLAFAWDEYRKTRTPLDEAKSQVSLATHMLAMAKSAKPRDKFLVATTEGQLKLRQFEKSKAEKALKKAESEVLGEFHKTVTKVVEVSTKMKEAVAEQSKNSQEELARALKALEKAKEKSEGVPLNENAVWPPPTKESKWRQDSEPEIEEEDDEKDETWKPPPYLRRKMKEEEN